MHLVLLVEEQSMEAFLQTLLPRFLPETHSHEIQCAVTRRHSSAGANPARQLSLQPVAVGADDGGNDIG